MKREENYLQNLANYIKKNVGKGYTEESLKWALVNQGYAKIEVEKAIKLANEQLAKEAPILKEKPVIRVETNTDEIKVEDESFWQKIKSWFS